MSSFFDKLGDMFVPKEIAPYLGMIAPMVAPQLGIFGSMALSQLGSFKQHGGKFDPFSAVATGIALASPQARAIRAAGRAGGQGTVGQALSKSISAGLPDGALSRALDPTQSVFKNAYGNYFESPTMAQFYGNPFNTSTEMLTPEEAIQGDFDQKYGTKRSVRGVDNLTLSEQAEYDKLVEADAANAAKGTETTLAKDFLSSDALGGGTIEDAGFFTKAGELGSNIAGSIFPGFGEYDPVTGRMLSESFDFGKALQTVSVAGTLGSLNTMAEELKKQKELDEQKQREIWGEWFKSYERTARKPYYDPDPNAPQSNYQDPVLLEKFKRFMLATGGRVGYNMGGLSGGIMGSSGVPQGMQVDGRNGTFIPMGVKEKADDVPAMLSKNEFVMTADAVKAAGDGDANVGAQRMYDLMHSLEAQV